MSSSPLGRVVALVPLRGGSKSIPRKNIRNIAGMPLCFWVIQAAVKCSLIDEVWVSTDDHEIREVVRSFDLGVKILDRPSELATDEASTELVMLHFASLVSFDMLVTIQATSPLLGCDDLEAALIRMSGGNFDSLVSGVQFKRFLWSKGGSPFNYDPRSRPRRQDFDGCVMENGAFYITSRRVLEREHCRLGGDVAVHVMSEISACEIDEPSDWREVESLLKQSKGIRLINDIKLVICDVDGTLTDGGMYYDEDGEKLKKFNTRDGVGIRLLREAGIEVAIVTGENSLAVNARARKLGIERVFLGVKDKVKVASEVMKELSLEWCQVAAIGDEMNDLPLMQLVGFAACPIDACENVRKVAMVLSCKGGQGVVRDFVDKIKG